MKNIDMQLCFTGDDVKDGEISVQTLTSCLININGLIQEANTVLNGGKVKTSVTVKAISKGSFIVELSLLQSMFDSTLPLVKEMGEYKDGITAMKELADILFAVGVAGSYIGGGLFFLIKTLKGKKIEKIDEVNGESYIHVNDTTYKINGKVTKLMASPVIMEKASALTKTVDGQGIDKLSIGNGKHKRLELLKEDASSFQNPVIPRIETIKESNEEIMLQIISLSFNAKKKWTVFDGGKTFSVTIEDEAFLNKITNDQISFSKHDYWDCRIQTVQTEINGKLTIERAIVEVVRHHPSLKQIPLL